MMNGLEHLTYGRRLRDDLTTVYKYVGSRVKKMEADASWPCPVPAMDMIQEITFKNE